MYNFDQENTVVVEFGNDDIITDALINLAKTKRVFLQIRGNRASVINRSDVINFVIEYAFDDNIGVTFGSVLDWSEIDLDKWLTLRNRKLLYDNALLIVNDDANRLFLWLKFLCSAGGYDFQPIRVSMNNKVLVRIDGKEQLMCALASGDDGAHLKIGRDLILSTSDEFVPNLYIDYLYSGLDDADDFKEVITRELSLLGQAAKQYDVIKEKYDTTLHFYHYDDMGYKVRKIEKLVDKDDDSVEYDIYLMDNHRPEKLRYRENYI